MQQGVARWIGERWRDLFQWPRNLLRDWPRRLQRIAEASSGRYNEIYLLPQHSSGSGLFVRLHATLTLLFDLLGGPEIAQYVVHLLMETRPLSREEQEAVASVLGPRAIRYEDVRIAQGGVLPFVFRRNGGRAFCMWHTIHLPRKDGQGQPNRSLLVHEATHVMQYERLGSRYIGEALYAQRRLGHGAYDYGGETGLQRARAGQLPLSAFNRESQAQIAQDYFRRRERSQDLSAYEPYLKELRAGSF